MSHATTYNNRCGTKNSDRWANEAIFLIRGANVLNVGEHPRLHTELHGASNDSCDNLTKKHRAMWNLHVVAKLEIARKLNGLGRGNMTPCFEYHHRNWAAREGISDDQLRNDVQPNLLGRNGLNHANRDGTNER